VARTDPVFKRDNRRGFRRGKIWRQLLPLYNYFWSCLEELDLFIDLNSFRIDNTNIKDLVMAISPVLGSARIIFGKLINQRGGIHGSRDTGV
jgi:hypothetical protein